MDPINIPQMLAYIPAPWILWVINYPLDFTVSEDKQSKLLRDNVRHIVPISASAGEVVGSKLAAVLLGLNPQSFPILLVTLHLPSQSPKFVSWIRGVYLSVTLAVQL